jgi:hypothetical protein
MQDLYLVRNESEITQQKHFSQDSTDQNNRYSRNDQSLLSNDTPSQQ